MFSESGRGARDNAGADDRSGTPPPSYSWIERQTSYASDISVSSSQCEFTLTIWTGKLYGLKFLVHLLFKIKMMWLFGCSILQCPSHQNMTKPSHCQVIQPAVGACPATVLLAGAHKRVHMFGGWGPSVPETWMPDAGLICNAACRTANDAPCLSVDPG